MRVNRQAIALHRYYELLEEAIVAYKERGEPYLVLAVGLRAVEVLGDEKVAVSTLRYWNKDYVEGNGIFKPDERGHHSRDVLVMEEDVKSKFVKWSLSKAKKDELSVDAARDFLNEELLCSLEACGCLQPPLSTS